MSLLNAPTSQGSSAAAPLEGEHSTLVGDAMHEEVDYEEENEEEEEYLDVGERQKRAQEERAREMERVAREEAEQRAQQLKRLRKEAEKRLLEERNNPSWSVCDGGCGGCWKFVEAASKCRDCGCSRLAHVRCMDDCDIDEADEDYESLYGGGESW